MPDEGGRAIIRATLRHVDGSIRTTRTHDAEVSSPAWPYKTLYSLRETPMLDRSLAARGTRLPARRAAGYQLERVQSGLEPADWRPMKGIGAGVCEIRIHGAVEHRVLYVATFPEAVYVLHAFEKKSRRTHA